jgi:hypothetical protein
MVIARYRNDPARLSALEAGEDRFNPGAPCDFGHVSDRYAGTGVCTECNVRRTRDARDARKIRQGSDHHAKNIAEGQQRAREFPPLPKLPKGMGMSLHAYSLTTQARDNSKYLDSLLAQEKPTEPNGSVEPTPERKRVGARHRIDGVNL